VTGAWNSLVATGASYADSFMGWKMAQHYGFKSIPAEGKRVQAIQITHGNNHWSVAENDLDFNSVTTDPSPGNTVVYADNNLGIETQSENGQINIVANGTQGSVINIQSQNTSLLVSPTPSECPAGFSPVFIMQVNGNIDDTYFLVNSKFITNFLNHTHISAASGSPTSIGTATMDFSEDLTTTLKVE
jgi:hypothetical protein